MSTVVRSGGLGLTIRRNRAAAIILLALLAMGLSPIGSLAAAGGGPGPTPRDVDAAVAFRAKLGLRADRAFVTATFGSPDFRRADWGVPLDAAEAAELGRRVQAEKAMGRALVAWAGDSDSAGAFIDQRAGGVTTFLTAGDPARGRRQLARLLPAGAAAAKARFVRVERSMDDLLALQARIDADVRGGALASFGVVSTAIDARANAVRVGLATDLAEVRAALERRYGPGVVAAFEPPAQGGDAGECNSRSDCPPAKGGIEIRSTYNGANCTTSFMVQVVGSPDARVLTAGHCVSKSGGTGTSRTWTHDGRQLGWSEMSTWVDGASADVAVLAPTEAFVDDERNLLLRASSLDVVPIVGLRIAAEQIQGGLVCRSGAVSGWRCGTIELTNRTRAVDGRTINHQWVVDFDACPGDSGGPYVLGDIAYGIHTDSTWGCNPGTNQAWYSPIGWALGALSSKGHPVRLCTTASCGSETNTWTDRGSLDEPVWKPWLMRLDDGRALHVGGLAGDPLGLAAAGADLPPPALFDPGSGTWTDTAAPPWAPADCEGQFAATLADGRVLVGGGRRVDQGDEAACDAAFLFDPSASPDGAWAPAATPPAALVSAGATRLGDGRVLVVGGSGANGATSVALAYDPATDEWASVAGAPGGAFAPLVMRLPDGRVLVSGGYVIAPGGSGRLDVSGTYLYNPATDAWAATNAVGAHGRAGTILSDGRVVLAGGQRLSWDGAQQVSFVNAVNVFTPASASWTTLPPLPTARADFSLVQLPSGMLLAAGGRVPGGATLGTPTRTTTAYDFASKAWYPAPAMVHARAGQGTAVLSNGTVLVAGGGTATVESYVAGDVMPPTATAPLARLRSGVRLNSTGIPLHLSWSATDVGGSGVGTFDIARSVDGGAFQTLASSVPQTSFDLSTAGGHTVRFQVRPRDWAGNAGAWKAAGAFRLSVAQQSSAAISYSGLWKGLNGAYAGGSVRYTRAAGASATFTFTGRGIGFVTTKGPKLGRARIYVDGVLATTINLYSTTWHYGYVAFQRTWTSSGTHRIKVVNLGTYGHPRLDVDAFVVISNP